MSTQTYSLAKNVYTAIAGPGNLIANITADQPAQIVFSPMHPTSDLFGHHLDLNQGISIASMSTGIIAWAKSSLDAANVMVTLGTDATVTTGASGNGGSGNAGGPGSLTFQSNSSTIGTAPTINVLSTKANIGVSGDLATLIVNVASNLDIESNGVEQGNVTALNFTGAGTSIDVSSGIATLNIPGSSVGISDEGISQGTATSINVTGLGGSANVVGSGGTIDIPGIKIFDEGVNQNYTTSINFVGALVTASVSGGVATINIPLNQNSTDIYLSPTGGDDCPQIWSAYQTLYNNGHGGTIHLSAGVFSLRTSPVSGSYACIALLTNHPGMITIKGQGKWATLLSFNGYSTACNCFVTCNHMANGSTARFLTLEDFTINAGYCIPQPYYSVAVIFSGYGKFNYQDIIIRRVDTKNLPKQTTQTPWKTSVDLSLYTSYYGTKNGQPKYTCERILVEDCNWGINNDPNGYGGNYGIQLTAQGFATPFPGLNGDTISHADLDDWTYNLEFNDITIRRCHWDSGSTISFANRFNGAPSTGFDIGENGHGSRWLIDGCTATRSGDDNFEINSGISATLINCTADSGNFENYFFTNKGGMPSDQSQITRVINCKSKFTYYIPNVTGNHANGQGDLACVTYSGFGGSNGSAPYGHFILENSQCRAGFGGDIAAITINNYTFKGDDPQVTYVATANGATSPIYAGGGIGIGSSCGRTNINMNNIIIESNYLLNFAGFSNVQVNNAVFNPSSYNAANVNISKVSIINKLSVVPGTSGTGVINFTPIGLFAGAILVQDTFAQSMITGYDKGYICDAGAHADVAVSASKLICIANVSTEKRFTWTGGYYVAAATGPFVDGCMWVASTPGTTTFSGYKTGIILKRSKARDGGPLNYVECYVSDDGSNTTLKIDVIINGTKTNRATIAAGTRIALGTQFWVMASIKGNLITLTYRSTAPSNYLSQGGAGTIGAPLTYTLSGNSEISLFGKDQLGYGGFTWIPIDSTSFLKTLSYNPLAVMEGKGIDDVTMKCGSNVSVFTAITYADILNLDKWVRFNGTFNLSNFNLTGASAPNAADQAILTGSPNTITAIPAIAGQYMRRSGKWIANTVPATITVSTGTFIYTNSDQCDEDIAVYGGTITSISLSKDRGASSQIVAVTGYNGFNTALNPGDIVTIISSVAPTMRKVPIF